MHTTELKWYTIAEAIPKPNYSVLIRLKDNPSPFRAIRHVYEPARYGFLFLLTNETVPINIDMKLNENDAICPANVIEWAYLS